MRKLFLLLLLCAPSAFAQCTPASGAAITCSPGITTANIASAVSGVTDGGVITFTPGTYSFTSAYVQLIAPNKGFSVVCQTPPTIANGAHNVNGVAVGAASINPCTIGTNSHFFGITTSISPIQNAEIRFSGFQIQESATNSLFFFGDCNGGAGSTGGYGNVRVDHITFDNRVGAIATAIQASSPACRLVVYGVEDHNWFQSSASLWGTNIGPSFAVYSTSPGQLGSSTHPSPPLGTGNNFFIEDNNFGYTKLSAGGDPVLDLWGDAAVVWRHNNVTDGIITAHAVTYGGGPANLEVYNNTTTMDAGANSAFQDCFRHIHFQGSNTMMFFNNVCTPATPGAHNVDSLSVLHYRDYTREPANQCAISQVTINSPVAGKVTFTGSFASCPTGGGCPAVGILCNNGSWWMPSGFVNAGNNQAIQLTQAATATTLVATLGSQVSETTAAIAAPGSFDGQGPTCIDVPSSFGQSLISGWNDANRSPGDHGYPCWRQPGRDLNGKYMPIYGWNNTFGDDSSMMKINLPDTGFGQSFQIDYKPFHMQYNREAFNAVSTSAQTSPTSPFDGTLQGSGSSATGMGFGTIANRPTTCTTGSETAFGNGAAGAGYFATDVGPQGTLYTCSATNTWTVYYTPFTYPHPLVGVVAPIATFTPSPVTLLVPTGLTSNPITVTLQNTGNTTLTNTSITLNNAIFQIQSNTCGSPATITNSIPGTGFTLTANSTCTFQVVASPVAAGTATTNAVFTENTNGGSDTLVLNVNGTSTPAPTTVMSAGTFPTHTLCPVRGNMTQLCLAEDCNCWWISINGLAYIPFGVSSVNGRTGNVTLAIK